MKKKGTNKTNVTVQDIAKTINISASTVSRALNNHPKISRKTKEKVWEAAQKLGYQPNIPIYLNQEQSRVICFMIPETDNPYYLDAIESVRQYTIKNNYYFFIIPTDNSTENETFYIQSLINLKIEGLIVGISNIENELKQFENLLNYNIPTVFINKSEFPAPATSIIPDVFQGGYKATKHLLSMNCKKIHLIIDNINNPIYADLAEGCKTAIEEENNINIYTHTDIINSRLLNNLLNNLKTQNELPDGIISGNRKINSYIVAWYENNNLKIPDDVLLAGLETGTNNDCNKHNFSSIMLSGAKIGALAAKSIFKQIEKKEIKQETIIVPVKFIIKNSSIRF